MDKFKNKYRIQSARLKNWDYGSNGAYFITICTHNREHFFGEIIKMSSKDVPEMQLNEIGQLAQKYWMEIPHHFPFVELGNFVVMPNHVHGILIIDKKSNVVDSRLIADLPNANKKNGGFAGDKNPMFHENISRIIRWYKGRTSFETRKINADFRWQSLFHDHIIRNSQSFKRIETYIENNPLKWNEDKFYLKNNPNQ